MVERKVGEKSIRLVRGDITTVAADAFVYDVTEDCKLGSGYGGAIASRGGKKIQEELTAIGTCPTGEAVVTSAGLLGAKCIVHVNGPKFHEPDVEGKLRRSVESALRRADERGATSLAFPPLGSGLYQVPLDLCSQVMVEVIESRLPDAANLREVMIVAADNREYAPFHARLNGRP